MPGVSGTRSLARESKKHTSSLQPSVKTLCPNIAGALGPLRGEFGAVWRSGR